MSTKHKTILLLLSSLVLLSTVGCSSTSTKENNKKSATSKTTIELTISAAASLKDAMAELEKVYTSKISNIKLTFNFGASGALQQQIEQGAPCDIFISAGKSQIDALTKGGLLLDGTTKNLLKNRLVLVGPSDTALTSLEDLKTDKVKHIAVGEPSSVPAGKYADEVLQKSNLKAAIKDKLVFAKDVKEVLSWSITGNAEAGFAYLSDATNNKDAKIIETIPEELHSPIIYPIAVIKSSKNTAAAKAFEDFLLTKEAQDIFVKYGYISLN